MPSGDAAASDVDDLLVMATVLLAAMLVRGRKAGSAPAVLASKSRSNQELLLRTIMKDPMVTTRWWYYRCVGSALVLLGCCPILACT